MIVAIATIAVIAGKKRSAIMKNKEIVEF